MTVFCERVIVDFRFAKCLSNVVLSILSVEVSRIIMLYSENACVVI